MTPNIQLKNGLCFLAFTLLMSCILAVHTVSANIGAYQIADVSWTDDDDGFSLRISGNSHPTYTMYELFAPQRIVLDIAGGEIAPSLSFPFQVSQGPVSMVNGQIIKGQEPSVARIEIVMNEEFSYTVAKEGSDVVVHFAEKSEATVPSGAIDDNQVIITDIQVDEIGRAHV